MSVQQKEIIDETLKRQIYVYTQHHKLSTPDSIGAFIEHITKTYNLALESVEVGSLIITVSCPILDSLERLWKDYQSGYLNDVAEKLLVSDSLKEKLGMGKVRFKISIEEENYLYCKKTLKEKSGKRF